ncbi:MAG: hypothetical protein AAF196_08985 [Planctomycetota bacterium]
MTSLEFNDGFMELRTNLDAFERMWSKSPEIVAFHARNMLGRWFGRHGREWRAQLTPKTRRLAKRGVAYYFVDPEARSAAQIRAAFKSRGLNTPISGKISMRSPAGLLLEFGGIVRPKRGPFLAIPAGKFRRMTSQRFRQQIGSSPTAYNRRNPRNPLFTRQRRTRSGSNPVLVRKRPGTEGLEKPRLETVYLLRRQVYVPPQLGVRDVWAGLESYRDRTMREALQGAVEDMRKEVRSGRS